MIHHQLDICHTTEYHWRTGAAESVLVDHVHNVFTICCIFNWSEDRAMQNSSVNLDEVCLLFIVQIVCVRTRVVVSVSNVSVSRRSQVVFFNVSVSSRYRHSNASVSSRSRHSKVSVSSQSRESGVSVSATYVSFTTLVRPHRYNWNYNQLKTVNCNVEPSDVTEHSAVNRDRPSQRLHLNQAGRHDYCQQRKLGHYVAGGTNNTRLCAGENDHMVWS